MSSSSYHPRGGRLPRHGSARSPTTFSTKLSLPPDREIMQELFRTPLQTISKPGVGPVDGKVEISNLEYVGSYNWTDSTSPTIIVPGSPREWLDKPMPYQVHADDGVSFCDQNGFRCPSAVLLPLFTAVERTAEADGKAFDWSSVDFVTDRNGLRKLLRWISGTASKDFRIDMQLAGERTILFNRWEKRTREQMDGNTYGFNFETASTRPTSGCEHSTGHHRIVRYDLNGLTMVVRFEVDAYAPSKAVSAPSRPAQSASTTVDDLLGAFSSINIHTPGTDSPVKSTAGGTNSATKLTVLSGGTSVPQSAIIEMTTRSVYREAQYDWKESYPQLFLSQTPHHFLAVHQRGQFLRVNKRRLQSSELDRVATSIQPDLKQLRRLLDIIKQLVIKHGERGRLSLVCQGGVLKVFQRDSQDSCLPDEVLERFTD